MSDCHLDTKLCGIGFRFGRTKYSTKQISTSELKRQIVNEIKKEIERCNIIPTNQILTGRFDSKVSASIW